MNLKDLPVYDIGEAVKVLNAEGWRIVKLEGPGNGSEWREDYFTIEEEL